MFRNKNANTALIAIGGMFAFLLILIAIIAGMFISAANTANEMENGVKYGYENLQSIHSQYTQKVNSIVQVPKAYKDDLKEVVGADISGRYGKDGAQATLLFLKERALNFDSAMYQRIIDVIVAGRNQYQAAETLFIDKKRSYETNLSYIVRGSMMNIMGYPKIDLNDYKTLKSRATADAFETGIEETPQLFQ